MMIRLKRVYDTPQEEDGFRVLVDRLWPRGIKKENAHVDLWLKDVAPSNQLRKWFGHDPEKWTQFEQRYAEEVDAGALAQLRRIATEHATITLLFAAKDVAHNNAVVLKSLLEK